MTIQIIIKILNQFSLFLINVILIMNHHKNLPIRQEIHFQIKLLLIQIQDIEKKNLFLHFQMDQKIFIADLLNCINKEKYFMKIYVINQKMMKLTQIIINQVLMILRKVNIHYILIIIMKVSLLYNNQYCINSFWKNNMLNFNF